MRSYASDFGSIVRSFSMPLFGASVLGSIPGGGSNFLNVYLKVVKFLPALEITQNRIFINLSNFYLYYYINVELYRLNRIIFLLIKVVWKLFILTNFKLFKIPHELLSSTSNCLLIQAV